VKEMWNASENVSVTEIFFSIHMKMPTVGGFPSILHLSRKWIFLFLYFPDFTSQMRDYSDLCKNKFFTSHTMKSTWIPRVSHVYCTAHYA